jgi:ABC-type multidrug transport system fused ATPase/permease subunit
MSEGYQLLDEQDVNRKDGFRLDDTRSMIYLFSLLGEHRRPIIFAFCLVVLGAFVSMCSAYLTGPFISLGLRGGNYLLARNYACAIIALEITALILIWRGRKKLAESSSAALLEIRRKLFLKLQQLPVIYYDRTPHGRTITRITHDAEGLEDFFTNSMGRLLQAALMATFAMIAMLVTHFSLGIWPFISILPVALFVYFTKEIVRVKNRALSKTSAVCNGQLSEFISGIEVIRLFSLEKWTMKRYQNKVDDYTEAHLDSNLLFSWSRPLILFLCAIPTIVLIMFAGPKLLAGTLSVSIFVSFLRYCEKFFNPVSTLANEYHVVQQAFNQAERLASFLMEKEESDVFEDAKYSDVTMHFDFKTKILGRVEFKNVKMRYLDDGPDVLKDISFVINAGVRVGVVGRTGSGKTTVTALLTRLYDFNQGEILLDNIPLRHYPRQFLREQIGQVSQDVVIFKGTLRENLGLERTFSDEELLAAARESGLWEKVMAHGPKLDDLILEGGVNLSAGERQLISLTRIFLSNPKILIMDEATAHVDPSCEQLIHQAMHRLMAGRTCFLIAHRLDTLLDCHQIMVFGHGKLLEIGAREELIAQKGAFFELLFAQDKQITDTSSLEKTLIAEAVDLNLST